MNKEKDIIQNKEYENLLEYIDKTVKDVRFKNGLTKIDFAKSVNKAKDGGFFKEKIRKLIKHDLIVKINANNYKFTEKAFNESKNMVDDLQGSFNFLATVIEDKKVNIEEMSNDIEKEIKKNKDITEGKLEVPYDDLKKMIEATRVIYTKFKNKKFNKDAIIEVGNTKESSSVWRRIALSLKKYGLISEIDDNYMLTENAIIFLSQKNLEEKNKVILNCFKKVRDYDFFKDNNGYITEKVKLEELLRKNHGYSQRSATEIVKPFLLNISFLKSLGLVARIKEEIINDKKEEKTSELMERDIKHEFEVTISLDISCGKVKFQFPNTINEISIEDLETILSLNKKVEEIITTELSRR